MNTNSGKLILSYNDFFFKHIETKQTDVKFLQRLMKKN